MKYTNSPASLSASHALRRHSLRFRIKIAVRILCISWASARNSDSSLNGLLTFLVRCHLSKNARSCFASYAVTVIRLLRRFEHLMQLQEPGDSGLEVHIQLRILGLLMLMREVAEG